MTGSTIHVAKDFSPTPGPRYVWEGSFSGEQFRNEILEPSMDKAIAVKSKLNVILDGSAGYGTSFLEEAFGGLARKRGIDIVSKTIEIISDEQKHLKDKVKRYILNANDKDTIKA